MRRIVHLSDLHFGRVDATVVEAVHPAAQRSILVIQAGTATSTRVRRELNSFNLIEVDPGVEEVTVESRLWDPSSGSFGRGQRIRYVGRGAWRVVEAP